MVEMSRTSWERWALRAVRALGVATLAGIVAGIIVGGIASRVAMRIAGIMAGPQLIGALTENGNRVGEITLSGSLDLIVFGGIFTGIAGGIFYAAFEPWVARLGRWRGIGLGIVLLAAAGFTILNAENRDFVRFGPPIANVLLFGSLFPLYGVVISSIAGRFNPWMDSPTRDGSYKGALAAGLASVGGIIGILALGMALFSFVGEAVRGTHEQRR